MNLELKKILNPKHTALLVIDIQKGYCDPNKGLPKVLHSDTDELQALIPRLKKFIKVARSYKVPIIFTRMAEDPKMLQENLRVKMKLENMPALTTPGKENFQYFDIKPNKEDKQIIKKHYNSFTGTDLDSYFKKKKINTLILTGAYTSRCVASTAIVASDVLGYNVFILSDLIGVPRAFESEPKGILSAINSILGYVVKSKDIKDAWSRN